MKNRTMIMALFLLIGGFINAQVLKGVISGEKAAELKGQSITVVVGSEEAKTAFEKALADCWSFNEIAEIVVNPNHKSKDEVSDKIYMKLRELSSESLPSTSFGVPNMNRYRYVSVGYELVVSKGGAKASLAEVLIPIDEVADLTDEIIYFGLSSLQEQLDYLMSSGAKNTMSFITDKYKNNDPSLKEKTLLVLENHIAESKKETPDEILSSYTASKVKSVDYEQWRDAIVNKEEDFAYLIIVPLPVGGSYVLRFNIVDCATGKLLAAYQPTVMYDVKGKNVKVDIDGKTFEKLSD